MAAAVSVVVVSDYLSSPEEARRELGAVVEALARQSFAGTAEHILVTEPGRAAGGDDPDGIVAAARAVLPSLRVVPARGRGSYAAKNEGVAAAAGDLVALLDADCVPSRRWIESFVRVFDERPEVGVVSGRTLYAGRSVVERSLAALSRSYVDRGHTAPTDHISNNNAAYRRALYGAHPLPTDWGPFASVEQSVAMRRAGLSLYFEPEMTVIHAFAGRSMERDIRRNLGWSAINLRRQNPTLPWSWAARLGLAGVPIFAAGRATKMAWSCWRYAEAYGLHDWDVPFAVSLAAVVTALEVPGMMRAARGLPVGPTAYT